VERWLERARSGNDAVFEVRGSAIGDARDLKDETVRSARWQQARDCGAEITLVFDGLDEASQRSPVLLNALIECLKRERLDKTRVLLVSRVADWRESQTGAFFDLWPKDARGGVYELCPLAQRDAELALRQSGIEPERFLQSLHDLRALWMAARPKLLLMLIDEFRAGGPLPKSRRELFHRAAVRMCSELDEERARRFEEATSSA
jgi:predicted NACHT family NTPase